MYPFIIRPNPDAVLYKLLKYSNRYTSFNSITEELNKHPDYPNLLALSDVLADLEIANKAYSITANDLNEINVPFIANTRKKSSEYVVVVQVTDTSVSVTNGNGRIKKMKRQDFDKMFTGVVMVLDKQHSYKSKNKIGQIIDDLSSFRYVAALLLILFMFISGIALNTRYMGDLTWRVLSLTVFKTTGLTVAILLFVQSINSKNPLVQKLCGGRKNNCNTVLNSKAAVVFKGLTWSDVGFFYFAGTWLMLLCLGTSIATLHVLALLNVLSLPYTFYSVYYQARVAKQWCVLCCSIQALLWLEFIPLATYIMWPIHRLNPSGGLNLLICLLLPVTLWMIFKPILQQLQKVKPLQGQLRNFKYNIKIFNDLINDRPSYATPDKDWSIVLGSQNAENILVMVSNPYCRPCAQAHEQLEEWLDKQINVQARIIFTANNMEQDRKTPIARHLMALNELGDKSIVKQALHDWYKQEKKDYKSWAKTYPIQLDENKFFKIDKQKTWCIAADINSTPTLLINGKRLPEQYQLLDIKYMLS